MSSPGRGRGEWWCVMDTRRYERWVIEAAAQARAAGASVVAITDTPLSPLVAGSDAHLLVRVVGAGPFDSLTGALSVVNALAAGVAARAHLGAGQQVEKSRRSTDEGRSARRRDPDRTRTGPMTRTGPNEPSERARRNRAHLEFGPTDRGADRARRTGVFVRGRPRGAQPHRRRGHRFGDDRSAPSSSTAPSTARRARSASGGRSRRLAEASSSAGSATSCDVTRRHWASSSPWRSGR